MDREKVIKGLEHCTSFDDGRDKFGGVGKCGGCPYYGHDCTDRMKRDALALLKEQETVEHAKEVLCRNGWEKMRFPEGTIGKWDDPEIVRCKDCKKYGDKKKCPIEALINSDSKQFFAFDENWYCADGERR